MSHYPFPSYTYQVIARGKILDSNTIIPAYESTSTSDNQEFVHRFSFLPRFDYTPKANIIVYYVKDERIVSTSVYADLYDDFRNFIELNVTPEIAAPGQMVDIHIKSNPTSYIGLLGFNQSLIELRSGNDLARDEIWNELEMFHSQVKRRTFHYSEKPKEKSYPIYNNPWDDFSEAGLILFSNTIEPIPVRVCYKLRACDMMERSSCFSESEVVMKPKIRKNFPESWIWESMTLEK